MGIFSWLKGRKLAPFTQWAGITQTDRFTCIETLSGYLQTRPEIDGYRVYFEPEVAAETLGVALLEAFRQSRFIPYERSFYDHNTFALLADEQDKEFKNLYKYRSILEVYKTLIYCHAQRSEGKISIKPYRRGAKQKYRKPMQDQTVVIPETADPIILSAAVKLALSRCK